QTPSAPFVIGCGLPSSSPFATISLAFGARYRSVTVPFAPISRDLPTRGVCAAVTATIAAAAIVDPNAERRMSPPLDRILRPFPSSRSTGAVDRVQHSQVGHRIFERQRHGRVPDYGLGEELGFDQIL